VLACGHACAGTCTQHVAAGGAHPPCNADVKVPDPRCPLRKPERHTRKVKCSAAAGAAVAEAAAAVGAAAAAGACRILCKLPLSCNPEHLCRGTCGQCWAPVAAGGPAPAHAPCTAKCSRVGSCGHECGTKHGCSDPAGCPPCQRRCALSCFHSDCGKTCHEVCTPCIEPCVWECAHTSTRCAALCGEPCTLEPCNEPCPRPNPLGCGHQCMGACGEECPEVCAVCARAGTGGGMPADWCESFSHTKLAEMEAGTRLVSLACGHVMDAEYLDGYVNSMDPAKRLANAAAAAAEAAAAGEAAVVGVSLTMPVCPECRAPMEGVYRIRNVVRRCQAEADEIKRLHSVDGMVAAAVALRGAPPGGPTDADLDALRDRANAMLERLGGLETLAAPHARAALRIKSFFVLAAVAAARVHTPGRNRRLAASDAAEAYDKLLAEPIRADDAASTRIRVDTAMDAAQLALTVLGGDGGRVTAMDKWRVAAQGARALGDRELVAAVERVQDGSAGEWARAAIVALVGRGHAFRCPNGHVYFVGECGGAMEETRCPDCGAGIGGRDHQLGEGNEHAPEVDGSHDMPGGAWAHAAGGLGHAVRQLGPGWG
jgi:hypothetical protein